MRMNFKAAARILLLLSSLVCVSCSPVSAAVSVSASALPVSVSAAATAKNAVTAGRRGRRRRLEDNPYFEYDLSEYSLRFEKCQDVKTFDDDLAADGYNSPLALKHFVIFRLCPSNACQSSSSSATNSNYNYYNNNKNNDACENGPYGQYVTDVDTYLQSTVEHQQMLLEDFCEACAENCVDGNGDYYSTTGSNNQDCSGCTNCDMYENLEAYGYVDASAYTQCQQVQQQQQNGGNDDGNGNGNGNAVYVGPRCSGNKITIGLFSDEDCYEPLEDDGDQDIEQILGGKLSYHLMTQSYGNKKSACLSCKEQQNQGEQNNNNNNYQQQDANNNAQANDAADADDVNEMCEDLYNAAAKCESQTGLTNGFIQTNKEEQDYENQVENEFMACNFINSLVWNSYTEQGEINAGDPQDVIVRQVTKEQKIALSSFILIFCVIGAVMEYFRRKIAALGERVQLTSPSNTSALA